MSSSSPSLRGLPSLSSLPKCPARPAPPPPSDLPRNVKGPWQDDAAEAFNAHSRLLILQGSVGPIDRTARTRSEGTGNRVQGQTLEPVGRYSKSRVTCLTATISGALSDHTGRRSGSEIENLKRQVSRLSSLRREDNGVQETNRAHALELERKSARHQAEIDELKDVLHAEIERRLLEREFFSDRLERRVSAESELETHLWRHAAFDNWKRLTSSMKAENTTAERDVAFRSRLQTSADRIAQVYLERHLRMEFLIWAVIVREGRKEAGHRHQMFTVAADSVASIHRVRADTKKAMTELKRQRRTHAISAVHSSIDRRLQVTLYAWSTVARDAQRETMYQRQFDIAAAESAASCAISRMQCRRSETELRRQKKIQALDNIRTGLRHWQLCIFHAWTILSLRISKRKLQALMEANAESEQACTDTVDDG